jgi:quercetin dioxygenase-like cupin family protein
MALTNPVLTGPQDGRTVTYGDGSSAELKVEGEQTDGQWAVVEWHVRAGDEPPIHTHTREDETVYVLEGAITAFVGDQQFEVEAGSYGALPKGLPHGLKVHGDAARLLVTLVPRPERSTSSFRGMRAMAIPRSLGSRSKALREANPDRV